MTVNCATRLFLIGCVASGHLNLGCQTDVQLSVRRAAPAVQAITTSWVGNTEGGVGERWVQGVLDGLHVLPDGTLMVIGHDPQVDGLSRSDLRAYKDGVSVAPLIAKFDNGRRLGVAIAGTDEHIFVALSQSNVAGGGDNIPAAGVTWFGVRRFDLGGKPSAFPGGKGPDESMLVVGTESPVLALAARGRTLYVGTAEAGGRVLSFDTKTLAPGDSWSVDGPVAVAIDRSSSPWVSEGDSLPSRVIHLAPGGSRYPQIIEGDGLIPVALSVDRDNRLLVADAGPRQQVLVYSGLEATPSLSDSLGRLGGLGTTSGSDVVIDRFGYLRAVAAEPRGGFVVGMSSPEPRVARIVGFASTRSPAWQSLALAADETAGFDDSKNELFTRFARFKVDWSRPAGKQFDWQGWTLDAEKYPVDPRLAWCSGGSTQPRILKLAGRRFLAEGTGNICQSLLRLDDGTETAVPVVTMGIPDTKAVPFYAARKTGWIWRDTDGDGQPDPDEHEDTNRAWAWGAWIDDAGDLWRAEEAGSLVRVPFEGLDAGGVPIYRWTSRRTEPHPAPFSVVHRILRRAEDDTMLLSGYTKEVPNPFGGEDYTAIGTEIVRYDHWSDARRALRWRLRLDITGGLRHRPEALTFAGKRLFVVYSDDESIYEFDLDTGVAKGSFRAGPEVNPRLGMAYIDNPLSAFLRANGEVVLFVADHLHAKITVFRLPP